MSRKINRRNFLQGAGMALGASMLPSKLLAAEDRPNIVFISIDDLNNYISPLGGYPGVHTPNINRLAKMGTTFTQAYCNVPFCGASRLSMMTGAHNLMIKGHSEDAYLGSSFDAYKRALKSGNGKNVKSIAHLLREHGYQVWGGGKLFHGGTGDIDESGKLVDDPKKDFDQFAWDDYYLLAQNQVDPHYRNGRNNDLINMYRNFEAGYDQIPAQKIPDKNLAMWAGNKIINARQSSIPYFLAVGLFRPHLNWIVPQKYFDLYPLDKIIVPDTMVQVEDLLDMPDYALRNHGFPEFKDHNGLTLANESARKAAMVEHYRHPSVQEALRGGTVSGHAKAIQAYLASITYADECVGDILNSIQLANSNRKTIIVLWSDHGWHLGEKLGWRKFKLTEQSLQIPMILVDPDKQPGVRNDSVVSSIDLVPTFVDYAKAPLPDYCNGISMRGLVGNPNADQGRSALSVWKDGGDTLYSIRDHRYRYITSLKDDVNHELYDLREDRRERMNLLRGETAGQYAKLGKSLKNIITRQRSHLKG